MLDRLSVPRRSLDFEDYIDILRRNVRWLIAPTFAGLVISTVVAFFIPDLFVSSALIRVVPQQVATDMVRNTSSQDIADRINSMAQNIESHNTLANIITQYGLYKDLLKKEPMEDVVINMKSHIGIGPGTGVNVGGKLSPTMIVAFSDGDRVTAQKVTQELVSRFINASETGTLEGEMAVQGFFDDELKQAKQELDNDQKKLDDFRAKNAGRLPDEVQTNLQQMNALDERLGSLNAALMRNNEQKMMYQSELNLAKERLASIKNPVAQAENEKLNALDREIENQENVIEAMKGRYTDDYPDLQDAQGKLAFLKQMRDKAGQQAAKQKPATEVAPPDNPVIGRERLEAQGSIQQLETQMKANEMERQAFTKDLQNVNSALRVYQSHMENVAGEKEYSDLLRDRELAKQRYVDLQLKRERSDMSVDLQKRKQGETLEMIDAASLPTTPTKPNRRMIVPIGAVVGLGLGILLVAIREVKDTSLKNLKDARLYTQLSILGSVPLLENDVVVQRRKQVMWIGWATATVVGLAIMAGSIAHYFLNKA